MLTPHWPAQLGIVDCRPSQRPASPAQKEISVKSNVKALNSNLFNSNLKPIGALFNKKIYLKLIAIVNAEGTSCAEEVNFATLWMVFNVFICSLLKQLQLPHPDLNSKMLLHIVWLVLVLIGMYGDGWQQAAVLDFGEIIVIDGKNKDGIFTGCSKCLFKVHTMHCYKKG